MELLLYVMTLNFMFEMGLLSIPFRILFLGDYTKSDRSAVFFWRIAVYLQMQDICKTLVKLGKSNILNMTYRILVLQHIQNV